MQGRCMVRKIQLVFQKMRFAYKLVIYLTQRFPLSSRQKIGPNHNGQKLRSRTEPMRGGTMYRGSMTVGLVSHKCRNTGVICCNNFNGSVIRSDLMTQTRKTNRCKRPGDLFFFECQPFPMKKPYYFLKNNLEWAKKLFSLERVRFVTPPRIPVRDK